MEGLILIPKKNSLYWTMLKNVGAVLVGREHHLNSDAYEFWYVTKKEEENLELRLRKAFAKMKSNKRLLQYGASLKEYYLTIGQIENDGETKIDYDEMIMENWLTEENEEEK